MSDQDEFRDRDTMHAPPFQDEPEREDDVLDDGPFLPPFEIFPDEPPWSAKRAQRDHEEREVVLSMMHRQERRFGLVLRLLDANQGAERAFKVETEARFNHISAENSRTNARLELLREDVHANRRAIRRLKDESSDVALRSRLIRLGVMSDGK